MRGIRNDCTLDRERTEFTKECATTNQQNSKCKHTSCILSLLRWLERLREKKLQTLRIKLATRLLAIQSKQSLAQISSRRRRKWLPKMEQKTIWKKGSCWYTHTAFTWLVNEIKRRRAHREVETVSRCLLSKFVILCRNINNEINFIAAIACYQYSQASMILSMTAAQWMVTNGWVLGQDS